MVQSAAGERVLVVDASVQITALLEEVLDWRGWTVDVAHDTGAALRALADREYGLVILDPIMAGPGGWGLLDHLAETRPELLDATILLTAGRYDARTDLARRREDLSVLFKPFDIDELRSTAEARCCFGSLPAA